MEENQNSQYGQPQMADAQDDEGTTILTSDKLGGGQSVNNGPQPMGGQSYGGQPMGGQPYSQPGYGQQSMGGANYGGPQPMNGANYGGPQPTGGANYGGPQPMGGANYGGPQPMGGANYGGPQPMNGPNYGGPQPMGGLGYGGPQPMSGQAYGQPGYGQAAQRKQSAGNAALNGLMQNVLGLFNAPADTSVKMVEEGSTMSGGILMGANALITCILTFVGFLIMGMNAGPAIGKSIYMLIFMLVANIVIAAAAYISGNIIFKSELSFEGAAGAVGTLAVYETVAIVLGIILETLSGLLYKADFISGVIGGCAYILFLAVGIAGVIIAAHGLYESMDGDDNKKILALIATVVIAVFVITVFDNIAQKIFSDSATCAEQVLYYFKNSASYTSYFRW